MSERSYIIFGFLLFVVGFLIFVRDVLSTNLSTEGEKYQLLEEQIKQLDLENQSLKQQLWTAESFQTIEQKARERGFIFNDTNYYYIH